MWFSLYLFPFSFPAPAFIPIRHVTVTGFQYIDQYIVQSRIFTTIKQYPFPENQIGRYSAVGYSFSQINPEEKIKNTPFYNTDSNELGLDPI